MVENIGTLMWGGLFFIAIGLWMWKKDRDQIQAIDNRIAQKEKDLYELYQSLEEIMQEMSYLYSQSNLTLQYQEPQNVGYQEQNSEGQNTEEQDKEVQNGFTANTDEEYTTEENINKHYRVIQLRNQGYDEEEIARQLGIGKGEVRLILGFKRERE